MSGLRLRSGAVRVQPYTFQDGDKWVHMYAVDSTTLAPRPATPEEIAAAKRPKEKDGLARPDSSTALSWEMINPPTPEEVRAMQKDIVDELAIQAARKKDFEDFVEGKRAEFEKTAPRRVAGPSL